MNAHHRERPDPIAVFLEPWASMDDDALLAHFRGARAPVFYSVADPQETRADRIDAILEGRFTFNQETHRLGEPIDWLRNPSVDVEWHILLHKFYYAVGLGMAWERTGQARYPRRWVELIDGWMRQVPPGFIAADVTGRRVQNWIYSYHHFVAGAGGAVGAAAPVPADFHRRLLCSIHEQVSHLHAHLTPKRNHRTLELYAIFLAAIVFPEFREAASWRDFALAQIVRNMDEDLLPDGVQCELSTDYHHLVLKNYLNVRRLASLNGIAVPAAMDAHLNRALDFSLHVHKPDGQVPSLSDGDVRSYRDLLALGAELYDRDDLRFVASAGRQGTAPAQRVAHFPDSGYTVVRGDWVDEARAFEDAPYLVFDCGPLGEGNHGHFDCLSLELAAHGRSLVVDPGRYTYSEAGETNWRVAFRSTAAHNTVCVDGRPQTSYLPKAVKPGTRHAAGTVRHKISGPAPEAALLERVHLARFDLLRGVAKSHEYPVSHERWVLFVDQTYWLVSDRLVPAGPGRTPSAHEFVLTWQLGAAAHDRCRSVDEANAHRLESPGLTILQPARPGQSVALEAGWVSETYGEKQAAPVLRSRVPGVAARFDTMLWPWRTHAPSVSVSDCPTHSLDSAAPDCPPALAVHVDRAGDGFTDTWWQAGDWVGQSCRIGDLHFSGRWVFWRTDSRGELVWLRTHAGAWYDLRADGVARHPGSATVPA